MMHDKNAAMIKAFAEMQSGLVAKFGNLIESESSANAESDAEEKVEDDDTTEPQA